MGKLGKRSSGGWPPSTTVTIVRAVDGSVGMRFLRPQGATCGPFQVSSMVPNSAAERSGAIQVGDCFCAVDGRDVSTLDDAAVAGLLRGVPLAAFTLSLCAGPPRCSPKGSSSKRAALPQAEGENEEKRGLEWAVRSGRLAPQNMQEFKELLQLLAAVSLPHAQVPNLCPFSLPCRSTAFTPTDRQ
jgi:hypothetical protein